MLLAGLVVLALWGAAARGRPQFDQFNTVSYISGADSQATILEEENQPNGGDGSYSYRFSTSNGITQNEEGVFEPGPEPDTGDMEVTGSYSYVDPQGRTRTVTYTAGVDGFLAQGDDIPTPVPTQYPLPAVPSRGGSDGGGGPQAFSSFNR